MGMRDLKMMIKTLENLDITNTGLVIDDGDNAYRNASAKVIKDVKGFYHIAFVEDVKDD